EIVSAALSSRGAVLVVDDLEEAFAFAAEYAAEHLLLAVRDPEAALPRVRHAGTVFFGGGASVAFGDYLTGANHVLPTAGAGRSFSGLSTLDFVRFTTYQRVDRDAARRMAGDVARLADSEGLPGHASAARAYEDGEVAAPIPAPRLAPRPGLRELRLYSSNRKAAELDLSDNTNQRGAPPAARAVLEAASAPLISRYPSHYADEVKRAAAAHFGVEADQVVTGCGSDDVIESTLRAFASPGDTIAYPDPTFAMIPYFAKTNGLVPRGVPLLGPERDYDADVETMLAARPRVLYLCSPNNPTGTLVSRTSIERVLREAPHLVVLDEAYAEYGGESFVRRARDEGRLLVVRTLSKAWGLAGQRVGVAIGAPELVGEIEKARGPYKVNALGARMATAALEEDGAWVEAGVRDVITARARFVDWLEARGQRPVPSHANFILLPVRDANAVAAELRDKSGIAVRPFTGLPGFGDALRISVGPWDVMERVLAPLAEALGCA
ncbi:MAG TPA: aminotransferase class I/II-fold pyridoxal phosphate-dependent enzyme, partial [Polyangiaceae bacterium]|nr:aminotransferase class I/II-fold pyridoxal phosphate-dependent enzyme [Polyangiaceae bacterium]